MVLTARLLTTAHRGRWIGAMKLPSLLLLSLGAASVACGQVLPSSLVLSEVDADTAGTDTLEFVELYNNSGSAIDFGVTPFTVVLFNGSNDRSYGVFGLTSGTLANGAFFVLGNTAVANVDLIFADNTLQNGADAVALYSGDLVASFPSSTAITTTNLVDAFVYDTSDPDDAGLLTGFGLITQYDEAAGGNKDLDSITRNLLTGEWAVATPTPGFGAVIPEPSAFAGFAGLAGLGAALIRRRKRA